ncbi:MAG: PDZ domain-containing protein [Phycisphaera sp.]|nr:PDZ domain-containing protein [Phycisphaera sp.]
MSTFGKSLRHWLTRACWCAALASAFASAGAAPTKSPGNKGDAKKPADAPAAGLLYPLGPVGGHGFVTYKTSEMRITQLDANAPGAQSGLKVGDVVTAVNGAPFSAESDDPALGGTGPARALGEQIEVSESDASRNGALDLTVKRDGEEVKVTVKLPRQPALSKTWPYDDAKSEAFIDGMCRYLAATQGDDGSWDTENFAGAHDSMAAWAGLALLASGDTKYDDNLHKLVEYLRRNPPDAGTWNWPVYYTGVFLSEYYLSTQDASVLPLIQARIDHLVKNQGKDGEKVDWKGTLGRFGHDTTISYNGGGLNIVTTGVVWFWALARQCGVKVPDTAWDNSMGWLKLCTGDHGGIGYAWVNDIEAPNYDCHGRCGQAALAAFVADTDTDYRKRWTGWLKGNTKSMQNNHAFTLLGMAPAFAALAATDPDGYRGALDEWRWYFTLARRPDFSADYIPAVRSTMGDGCVNPRGLANACLAFTLSAARKRLYIYGGFPRIPGIRFGDLSPRLRTIYTMIRDKQVRAALNATAPLIGGSGDDAEKARLLYEFIVGPARTRFAEIVAVFDRRELYEGNLELRNFVDLYGDLPEFRGKSAELNVVYNDPANKQQVEAGRTYHLRLAYLQHSPGAADKVYKEFLDMYAANEPYTGWIKSRLGGQTPADSVARLAALVAPEGDDAKAAARLNRVAARGEAIKSLVATLRPQVAPLDLSEVSPPRDVNDTRARLAERQLATAERVRRLGQYFQAIRIFRMIDRSYSDTPSAEIARQWVEEYGRNEPLMEAFTAAERAREAAALLKLAESLRDADHRDAAQRQFKMLIELYPETDAAKKARHQLTGS